MKKLSLILLMALMAIPMMQANSKDAMFRHKLARNNSTQVQGMPMKNAALSDVATTRGTVSFWDFEDASQLDDWSALDNDGDGFNWTYFNNQGLSSGLMNTYSGYGVMASASYDKDSGLALFPDNWLISPVVDLGGFLSFYAAGQDPSYADEVFAVYVCVGSPTSIYDFVKISEDITVTGDFLEYSFDLTAYAGQEGCFAIRHYNVTDQFWLNIDDVTLDPNAVPPAPLANTPVITNVAPTATTAAVTWENENATKWDLRYRKYNPNMGYNLVWDFEDQAQINQWVMVDNDGDGNNWFAYNDSYYAYTGEGCMMSASYVSGVAVSPDNWLMSPVVPLDGTLSFWAAPVLSSFPDVFAVYVSVGEGTDVDNFVLIGGDYAPTAWTEYTFDLSAYAGQEGRFAIRHYNCYDEYRLRVDDVALTIPGEDPYEWVYVNGITEPNYNIEGLDPETTYEVQVMGYNADMIATDWSEVVLFTTLAGGPEPTEKTQTPDGSYAVVAAQHEVVVTITPYEGDVFYRIIFTAPDGTVTETDWMPYVDAFSVYEDGRYRIEFYAVADGKLPSDPGAVEFTVTPITGVDEMTTGKTVAGVRYFNAVGQEMQEANGMTIVVTTYTDGTTSAVKVMK